MKKNLYFRSVLKSESSAIQGLGLFFLAITTLFRSIVEVFMRKNFGERYFGLGYTLIVTILCLIMEGFYAITTYKGGSIWSGLDYSLIIFLIVYWIVSIRRAKEIDYNPSVFDFEKFSLYSGDTHPYLASRTEIGKWTLNPRNTKLYFEPIPFYVLGVLLLLIPFTRLTGLVLIIGASCHTMATKIEFSLARGFLLDKIDEIICNEDLYEAFVNDTPSKRGLSWIGPKLNNQENMDKVFPHFFDDLAQDEGERVS